jgi:CheY-like chemotaxis protein
MNNQPYNLLLADDDDDDCTFFKDALEDLHAAVNLTTVNNGAHLMKYLSDCPFGKLPDILFLDLNMPLKNGFECLAEIKLIEKLKELPVIIWSTSLDIKIVDLLYEKGAVYYIRKPGEFSQLKKVIALALATMDGSNFKQPKRDHFILEA